MVVVVDVVDVDADDEDDDTDELSIRVQSSCHSDRVNWFGHPTQRVNHSLITDSVCQAPATMTSYLRNQATQRSKPGIISINTRNTKLLPLYKDYQQY